MLENQEGSKVRCKNSTPVYAIDFIRKCEGETIIVYKTSRYLCANCSKIFQSKFAEIIPSLIELMCLEETLTNLITDPKGQETPQELLKKALDIFRGIRGKYIIIDYYSWWAGSPRPLSLL
jgi:hypothetical protein